jgi:hypothetical protein
MTVRVTSSAFGEGGALPEEYTCWGAGRVPPLEWSGVPDGTTSLAVVVHDPDAPRGTFVHWVLYDVPGTLTALTERPKEAREGTNSAGRPGWHPPCPPTGTHRYVFTVYALRSPVEATTTEALLAEIERQSLASGSLTGVVTARPRR